MTMTARPTQEPEVFPIVEWHRHPQFEGFYIFRNGDLWLDVGSHLGDLGRFDVRQLPMEQWVQLQDRQGSPLPVAVYVQRFGQVFGRWLSDAPSQPQQAAPAPTQSSSATQAQGLDLSSLFALAPKQQVGVPPEFQAIVNDFADFAGCILGIVLSNRQLDILREAAVKALSEGGDGDAQVIQSTVSKFQEVKSADANARLAWRQQHQATFVQWLSRFQQQSALCGMLTGWYAQAQQPIAAGTPPLTREAAESWAELYAFAMLVAQGKEPGTETPADLESSIARLAQDYPRLAPPQQLFISSAPVTLYELRRSWPAMSAQERNGVRAQLAGLFGISAGSAGIQGEAPAIAPGAAPAAAPASAATQTNWDQFRDNTSVASLQRQWTEAKAKGDEAKAAQLQLDIQKALQNQAEASAMLSNITNMNHSMMMAVANNLRA